MKQRPSTLNCATTAAHTDKINGIVCLSLSLNEASSPHYCLLSELKRMSNDEKAHLIDDMINCLTNE